MAKKPKVSVKKNRRTKERWPNLKVGFNLKSRVDLIDYDYLSKLSDVEKDWLNQFSSEYIGASFDKDNKKNLHKTPEGKKSCYDRNNARNRDVYTNSKIKNTLVHIEDMKSLTKIVYDDDEGVGNSSKD